MGSIVVLDVLGRGDKGRGGERRGEKGRGGEEKGREERNHRRLNSLCSVAGPCSGELTST